MEKPNVLVLDEPTNHLDLEAIEALVEGLKKYPGTLIFVSHDRWFVSRLAQRIIEITTTAVRDYEGTYEEYVAYCGDDHLDTEATLRKARRKERQTKGKPAEVSDKELQNKVRKLDKRRAELTEKIDQAEARVHEINDLFCDASYFDRTPHAEVRRLEQEQKTLNDKVAQLLEQWEQVERELESLEV